MTAAAADDDDGDQTIPSSLRPSSCRAGLRRREGETLWKFDSTPAKSFLPKMWRRAGNVLASGGRRAGGELERNQSEYISVTSTHGGATDS